MNFFYEHLAHGVVGLAAVASLGLGGGVAAHTIQTHADSKARIEVRNEADKREHKEAKHSTNVAPKHVDITIGASGRVLVHGATVTGVSSTSVIAKSSIGVSVVSWTVNTGSARIIAKGDGTTTLGSIVVGDSVNFSGTLSTNSAFTVNAGVLRDTTR